MGHTTRSVSEIAKEITSLDRAHADGQLSGTAYEAARSALLGEMKAAAKGGATTPTPPPSSALKPPSAPVSAPADPPEAAALRYLRYAAATSAFLLALGLFGISCLQVLVGFGVAINEADGIPVAAGQGSIAMWLTAASNLLVCALHVVIGVGILQRKRWAYNWGVGTGIVNAVFILINICLGACLLIPLLPLDVLMAAFLYMAKSEFPKPEDDWEQFASKR